MPEGASKTGTASAMPSLYIVATPIGNLEDITLRGLRVLGEVDLVFAEDTRRTRILLERHGVQARPRSLHSQNEARRIGEVLEALAADRDVALVSDAGTPLVSDPGAQLVAAAVATGGNRLPAPPTPSVLITNTQILLRYCSASFCVQSYAKPSNKPPMYPPRRLVTHNTPSLKERLSSLKVQL